MSYCTSQVYSGNSGIKQCIGPGIQMGHVKWLTMVEWECALVEMAGWLESATELVIGRQLLGSWL